MFSRMMKVLPSPYTWPRLIGLSALWFWMYCSFFLASKHIQTRVDYTLLIACLLAMLVGFGFLFIYVHLCNKKLTSVKHDALFGSLGILAACFVAGGFFTNSGVFIAVGLILSSISATFFLIEWHVHISVLPLRNSTFILLSSAGIAAIFAFIYMYLPLFIHATTIAIMPAITAFTNIYSRVKIVDELKQARYVTWFQKGHEIKRFHMLLISTFVFYFYLIITVFCFTNVYSNLYLSAIIVLVFISLLVSLAFTYTPLYRDVTPGSILTRLILPLSGILYILFSYGLDSSGYIILFLMFLLAALHAALMLRVIVLYKLPRLATFILFFASVVGGTLLGTLVFTLISSAEQFELSQMSFSILSLALLTIINALFLSEKKYSFTPMRHLDDESDDSVYMGRWKRACVRIGEQYELTPRESEVFEFLAKGRQAEYIANALVLSPYTVKTHIRNIYSKLDIHSQNEVLDMVEDEKAELAETANQDSTT